jgi:hypothetical protein
MLITPNTPPTRFFPMGWGVGWTITSNIVLFLLTVLVVIDTRLRFDRIAGRMAGGTIASRVDAFLYGHDLQPVFLPARNKKSNTKTEDEAEAEVKVDVEAQPVPEPS